MAVLNAQDRKALPKGDFAMPGQGKGPGGKGAGSYPISDENHARNALARVSQHGTPEEQSKVRAAVTAKFPHIVQEHDKAKDSSKNSNDPPDNLARRKNVRSEIGQAFK